MRNCTKRTDPIQGERSEGLYRAHGDKAQINKLIINSKPEEQEIKLMYKISTLIIRETIIGGGQRGYIRIRFKYIDTYIESELHPRPEMQRRLHKTDKASEQIIIRESLIIHVNEQWN